MKKIIATIGLTLVIFMAPSAVRAEESVCVTQYGGAVVCGAKTPQFHELKKTGLADFNIPIIGGVMLAVSGVLYFKSRGPLTA